ncbi:hypothetical protein IJH24_02720 [Candidatus Saccharibacteria bacterium]|nr:hypothetical protein [Candidatus Saccharibacteria bacterium]
MEPNLENVSNEIVNASTPTPPAPAASAPSAPIEEPKNSKTLAIIFAIIATICFGAAVAFAALYFTEPKSSSSPISPDTDSSSDTTLEETAITDATILGDLDRKIALLFSTSNTGPTFATGPSITNYDIDLFHNGDLSQSDKVRSIIMHTLELTPLNEEEITAVISQDEINSELEQYFRQNLAKGVDGDLVVKKYKEIYGEDFSKGEISTLCGNYKYNEQYDFYYSAAFGCGGMTPYERFYYKNRYTTDGNYAYVYTSTAFLAPTPQDDSKYYVYCDIADLGTNGSGVSENAEICATLQSYDEKQNYTLDASNYEQYAEYRFVFKIADGNYYFEKVEKL